MRRCSLLTVTMDAEEPSEMLEEDKVAPHHPGSGLIRQLSHVVKTLSTSLVSLNSCRQRKEGNISAATLKAQFWLWSVKLIVSKPVKHIEYMMVSSRWIWEKWVFVVLFDNQWSLSLSSRREGVLSLPCLCLTAAVTKQIPKCGKLLMKICVS